MIRKPGYPLVLDHRDQRDLALPRGAAAPHTAPAPRLR
jgi:hypothetical protein